MSQIDPTMALSGSVLMKNHEKRNTAFAVIMDQLRFGVT